MIAGYTRISRTSKFQHLRSAPKTTGYSIMPLTNCLGKVLGAGWQRISLNTEHLEEKPEAGIRAIMRSYLTTAKFTLGGDVSTSLQEGEWHF